MRSLTDCDAVLSKEYLQIAGQICAKDHMIWGAYEGPYSVAVVWNNDVHVTPILVVGYEICVCLGARRVLEDWQILVGVEAAQLQR